MSRCLLALAAIAGCSQEIAGGRADGPAVFAAACANCHGATGKPEPALVAGLGVKDLTAPEFRHRVTVELVVDQVRGGSKNKRMPAFADVLHDDQILAVARYVVQMR